MPKLLDNPAHWRARAEEVRTIADQLDDPKAREMMLKIADTYEKLARNAEARTRSSGETS